MAKRERVYRPERPKLRTPEREISKTMKRVLVAMLKGEELIGRSEPHVGSWALDPRTVRALNDRGLIIGTGRDRGYDTPVKYVWKLSIEGKQEALRWMGSDLS